MAELIYGNLEPPIRVSPSALDKYDACPYQFYLSRKIRLKEERLTPALKRGIEVHGLMAGEIGPEAVGEESLGMYKRLLAVMDGVGFHVVERELAQQWEIAPGILMTRRVDALVQAADGDMVVVDYKTASRAWRVMNIEGYTVVPYAHRRQTAGYLVPPAEVCLKEVGVGRWPETLWYFIVPSKGAVQTFPVCWSDDLQQSLDEVLDDVVQSTEKARFRQVKGFTCQFCDFAPLCYAGRQDLYDERKSREDTERNNG